MNSCRYSEVSLLKCIWVRSWNCGCFVTWFCYQLIAKPGNKTARVSWPYPYPFYLQEILTILQRKQQASYSLLRIGINFRIGVINQFDMSAVLSLMHSLKPGQILSATSTASRDLYYLSKSCTVSGQEGRAPHEALLCNIPVYTFIHISITWVQ